MEFLFKGLLSLYNKCFHFKFHETEARAKAFLFVSNQGIIVNFVPGYCRSTGITCCCKMLEIIA
jgi:hypothetical protein